MKKILIGTALAVGLMATSAAQADTDDALLGGLLGVAIGVSLADDDDHHHHRVSHHYYQPRPVRHHYYAPPRHVYHHPRGNAYGYWNHNPHRGDRRDWDRRGGRHDGRGDWDGRRDGRADGDGRRDGRDGHRGRDRG